MGDNKSGERMIMVAVDEGEESEYALTWSLKNILRPNQNSKDILILLYAKPLRAGYTPLDNGTGYLFSSDVIETMEKYNNEGFRSLASLGISLEGNLYGTNRSDPNNEVAQCVMSKANRICNDIKDYVKVETIVQTGDPRDVICETAEKLGVDMLVMGSHGYGLIKRAFLGSVSNHCAQNVKCPVLIVKTPPKPKPKPPTGPTPTTPE